MSLNLQNFSKDNSQKILRDVQSLKFRYKEMNKINEYMACIMLYDTLRKNDLDTNKHCEAINKVIKLINTPESITSDTINEIDDILLKSNICWAMGNRQ